VDESVWQVSGVVETRDGVEQQITAPTVGATGTGAHRLQEGQRRVDLVRGPAGRREMMPCPAQP
jgi:hypothetical protein